MSRGKRLTDAKIEVVLALSKAGKTYREIASLVGISPATIPRIVSSGSVEVYRDYLKTLNKKNVIPKINVKPQKEVWWNLEFIASEEAANEIAETIAQGTGRKVGLVKIERIKWVNEV